MFSLAIITFSVIWISRILWLRITQNFQKWNSPTWLILKQPLRMLLMWFMWLTIITRMSQANLISSSTQLSWVRKLVSRNSSQLLQLKTITMVNKTQSMLHTNQKTKLVKHSQALLNSKQTSPSDLIQMQLVKSSLVLSMVNLFFSNPLEQDLSLLALSTLLRQLRKFLNLRLFQVSNTLQEAQNKLNGWLCWIFLLLRLAQVHRLTKILLKI